MNDEVAAPAELDPKGAAVVRAEAAKARRRELERTRRADAARVSALVRYMLRRGDDRTRPRAPLSAPTLHKSCQTSPAALTRAAPPA